MLQNISNLGQALSKNQQQSIHGGIFFCFIHSFSDLVECQERGGEIVYCAPHVECDAID
ncbi:hypothetical protein [uncultured Tenacibaculum sp.]|uniref:hypothetical protein n=1 Tax=uncultured Tenacibaculum sp. TaxID=174713 RepID=UPI00262BBD8E|nr:hypothetical protein [uncultured Tenacibaculum sp.]